MKYYHCITSVTFIQAPCASLRRRRPRTAAMPCASFRSSETLHATPPLRVTPPRLRRARHSAAPAPCASLRRAGSVRVTPPRRRIARHSAAPAPYASLRRAGSVRAPPPRRRSARYPSSRPRARHYTAPVQCAAHRALLRFAAPAHCASLRRAGAVRVTLPQSDSPPESPDFRPRALRLLQRREFLASFLSSRTCWDHQ